MPRVSVIIATYNWSEALRCALRSLQLQIFTDFEVMVVGDACTDDSADVVAGFADPRFRWMNRARNAGGQWAPNNDGISEATGEFIAYLGHDDLWYPTHLESLVRAADANRADVACAIAMMYGPPETGVRAVCGVFRDGAMDASQFVVPSSLMHTRTLIERIGPWRDPDGLQMPTDCELVRRAFESGARFVATDELTVFKFNAAWRRDAYGRRRTDEQRELLAKIESGVDFRTGELIGLVRAFVSNRTIEIRMPVADEATAGAMRSTRTFKGARASGQTIEPLRLARLFTLADQPPSLEWYAPQGMNGLESYRWSGPSNRSMLRFPASLTGTTDIRVHVVGVADPDRLEALEIEVDGTPVGHAISTNPDGSHTVRFRAESPTPSGNAVSIQFKVEGTTPPAEDPDRRPRGIAVASVEFVPINSR